MSILKLVHHPHPVLRQVAQPVTTITAEITQLIADMFDTMYHERGVGLAAPQVGVSLQLAIIDVTQDRSRPYVLINPQIIDREGSADLQEGCLSVPGAYHTVKRPHRVVMKAQNAEGHWYQLEGEGLLAEAMDHEYDHLQGVLFFDQLSKLKQQRLIGRMQKYLKQQKKAQKR